MLHARRFLYALVFLVASAASAGADEPDDKPITIPLDQIWALNMPGTRELTANRRSSTGEYVSSEGPLVEGIGRAIRRPPSDGPTRPGFAVLGTGTAALQEVHAVLTGKKNVQQVFPAGKEISIFFFAHPTGQYLKLDKVQVEGRSIKIWYQFVPHLTAEITMHFAVIPIGQPAAGEVDVSMIQSPMAQEFIDRGFKQDEKDTASRVCKSFRFTVQ